MLNTASDLIKGPTYHEFGVQSSLLQLFTASLDMLSLVVWSLGGSTQDDVSRVVAVGLDNGGETLLGD